MGTRAVPPAPPIAARVSLFSSGPRRSRDKQWIRISCSSGANFIGRKAGINWHNSAQISWTIAVKHRECRRQALSAAGWADTASGGRCGMPPTTSPCAQTVLAWSSMSVPGSGSGKGAAVFAVTARFCAQVGWEYQRVGELDPVRAANLRWLADGHCRPSGAGDCPLGSMSRHWILFVSRADWLIVRPGRSR